MYLSFFSWILNLDIQSSKRFLCLKQDKIQTTTLWVINITCLTWCVCRAEVEGKEWHPSWPSAHYTVFTMVSYYLAVNHTSVNVKIMVLWSRRIFSYSDDRDNGFLWNVGICLQDYMASHPKRFWPSHITMFNDYKQTNMHTHKCFITNRWISPTISISCAEQLSFS
jgi:hypothetical protein